jgi:hypothetical protein
MLMLDGNVYCYHLILLLVLRAHHAPEQLTHIPDLIEHNLCMNNQASITNPGVSILAVWI